MSSNLRSNLGFTEERRLVHLKKQEDLNRRPVFARPIRIRSAALIALIFLCSVTLSVLFGFKTMIPLRDVGLVIMTAVFISTAWQYFQTSGLFPLRRMDYLAVGIFGLSPFLICLFFLLNFFVLIESDIAVRRVNKMYYGIHTCRFDIAGIPCSQYPELCKTDNEELMNMVNGQFVTVHIGTGLFGYRVLRSIEP